MPTFSDQLGRIISIPNIPKRIISLVPSQTELLFDLGLSTDVVGITKFCIHPDEWFRTKKRIGGTKNIHIEQIHLLQPDLIIANKEENTKEQIEELTNYYPVWISDVNNLMDAVRMIRSIGIMTGTEEKATKIISEIQTEFSLLQNELKNSSPESKKEIQQKKESTNFLLPPQDLLLTGAAHNTACYLIWKDPYLTIGGDTFINDMMQLAGFINVFNTASRYPEITISQLQLINPSYLLLSSEPYPFQQKHMDQLQEHLPQTKILLVDGEMFSWYGSRLLKATKYFRQLLKTILRKQL